MSATRAAADEVNFDGVVGPSYNYAALSPGNLASGASRGRRSNPRAAALEGLAKAETLLRLGVKQAVLPPLVRPQLEALYRIGLIADEGLRHADDLDALARHLAAAAATAPELLAAAFSASSVWTANCATASPSADSGDARVHFTPANMSSLFHRSLEAEEMGGVLRQVFADAAHFVVHDPLPGAQAFADEGAANHLRLAARHGDPAVNVFVYGREGAADREPGPRFPARQTRLACEAVARLHRLAPERTIFARQNPVAIDAGVFHNDVIATAHRGLLFYHEHAFADAARTICEVSDAFAAATGGTLRTVEARAAELSLEQAVASYLFNSQIVDGGDGRTILVAPRECRLVPGVRRYLDRLMRSDVRPFDEILYVNTTSSMRNGGGPACLRLRVVLTGAEQRSISGRVLLTDDLLKALRFLIEADYPTDVAAEMFAQASFLKTCFAAAERLYALFGLAPIGLPGMPVAGASARASC